MISIFLQFLDYFYKNYKTIQAIKAPQQTIMNTFAIPNQIFHPDYQTLTPSINSISNSSHHIPFSIGQGQRIVSNKLRGFKLHMSQIRQKQLLKTQFVKYIDSSRNFVNGTLQGDFFNNGYGQMKEYQISHTQISDNLKRSVRPRTGGLYTADSTLINKRKRMSQSIQSSKNRKMEVTSYSVKNRMKALKNYPKFISQNLDEKTNNYMNFFISNEMAHPPQYQNTNSYIPSQGLIQHNRPLNNFERKMKKKIKSKSQSKQKLKIKSSGYNDLKEFSKTLETLSSHNQSPIFNNLEYNTMFGKYTNNKNFMKKTYLLSNQ